MAIPRDLICSNESPTTTGPIKSTTETEAPGRDEDGRDSPRIPGDMQGAAYWDQWWKDCVFVKTSKIWRIENV